MKQQTISKRELIVQALTKAIATLADDSTKVYRNLDKPLKMPSAGVIIIRDNEAAKEVEVLLNPLVYVYELTIQLEVMAQHQDAAARNYVLDMLLMEISRVVNTNRTLYGLAEYVEVKPAEFADEAIDGAATVRSAMASMIIRYNDYDFTRST